MGIADRHYVRERSTGGGGMGGGGGIIGSMRMWSANAWIIALCIAVFVVDSFMPPSTWAPVRVPNMSNEPQLPMHVYFDSSGRYRDVPMPNEPANGAFRRPVVDMSQTPPQEIGFVTYSPMPPLMRWLYFSTEKGFLSIHYWRFIGFQFLHANLTHLLFNMLGLFFFGSLVERYLGAKRYVAFYLLCGICGALMFLLLNLGGIVTSLLMEQPVRVPGLLFNSPDTPLIGASAGVFGVLMAGAYLAPRATVLVFFFFPMQLRTLAYALVVIALLTVITGGNNAGGEAGHIGGAIAGFYLIRYPHHLHGFFDILGWLDPTSHHYRNKKPHPYRKSRPTDSAEVDRVLDKVRAQGLQSLTDKEKQILKDATRES